VTRLAEVALIAGVVFAVLAFGGTNPAYFALVQIILLGAAALAMRMPKSEVAGMAPAAFAIPAALAGIALLQICPLPEKFLFVRHTADAMNDVAVARKSLSFAPYSTRTSFLILITCFAAFFLAQIVGENRERKRRFINSLLVLGTAEALYGLVQYLSGWQYIFAYAKIYDLEEATGTYINRNHYAGFLEMILPFSVALLFYEYEKSRGAGSGTSFTVPVNLKSILIRQSLQRLLLFLAVAVVLFAALCFSRSRMGIAAAVASLSVMFGLAGLSRSRGKKGLVLAGAFAALSLGLAVWIGPGPIVERFENVGQEFTMREQSRFAIWQDSRALVREHPLLGTGLGTFPIVYTQVQTTFLGQFVNHAHNDYLELAVDLGVPTALLLYGSICMVFARAARGFFHAHGKFERYVALGCAGSIVAILLHSLTDFNLYIPANAILFSTILGLAMTVPRPNSAPWSAAP